jgi:hypothetical protein
MGLEALPMASPYLKTNAFLSMAQSANLWYWGITSTMGISKILPERKYLPTLPGRSSTNVVPTLSRSPITSEFALSVTGAPVFDKKSTAS